MKASYAQSACSSDAALAANQSNGRKLPPGVFERLDAIVEPAC
jgi:hypothetical protein